jgi:hypothetical protein
VNAAAVVTTRAIDVDENSTLQQVTGPCTPGAAPECAVAPTRDTTVTYQFVAQNSPSATGVRSLASSSGASEVHMVSDDAGNVYALLRVKPPFAVGASAVGASDTHAIAKWTSAGTLAWLHGVRARSLDALAVDPVSGDVWFGGGCDAASNLGGAAAAVSGPCFAHWSTEGVHVLSRAVAGTASITDAAAGAGQVLFGGSFSGVLTIDGQTMRSAGNSDGFAFRVGAADLVAIWGRRYGGIEIDDFPVRVAVSRSGTYAVAGSMRGNGTAEALAIRNANFNWTGFAATYAADGTSTATRAFMASTSRMQGLAFDGEEVLVGGKYTGAPAFAPALSTPPGLSQELFVARLATGTLNVVGAAGTTKGGAQDLYDVAPTASGGMVALYQVPYGGINFGGGLLVEALSSSGSIGLSAFDRVGTHRWSKKLASSGGHPVLSDAPRYASLSRNPTQLTVAGLFRETLNLAPRPTTTKVDLFFATFAP